MLILSARIAQSVRRSQRTKMCLPSVFLKTKKFVMEATPRFELGNQGFADPCLTTWLCRRIQKFTQK